MSTIKTRLAALALISALAVLFPGPRAAGQVPADRDGGRTWALVVGISRYPKLPGGQQLQFAERDAADFAHAISGTVAANRVRVLLGQQATSANIKSSIGNWLAQSAWEADTIILFFSGHAFVERDFGETYLLASDSDLKDPYTTGLSLSELSHALSRRVRARRVLLIADAVRRDLFPPESDAARSNVVFESFDRLAASRPGLTAILASGPGEFSREGQRWGGRGVFTKHLLDGLSGSADGDSDGNITAGEVFEYVSAKVSEDTSNKQRPWRTETAIAQVVLTRAKLAQSSAERPSPQAQNAAAPPPSPKGPERAVAQGPRQQAAGPVETGKPVAQPPAASRTATTTAPRASAPAKPPPSHTPSAPAANPPEIARVTADSPAAGRAQPPNPPISTKPLPAPPRPTTTPPAVSTVAAAPARASTESVRSRVPVSEPGAPPSPLALQLEAMIESGSLVGPGETNAWDLFERLSREPNSANIVAQMRPKLGAALLSSGRAIIQGDVRSDNIGEKVDDFKRAGQLFSRARSLMPENAEAQALEKLSASAALIALQFYDEAERSLSQIQGTRLAAIENALGIIYRGKYDDFRAERAFKRATEIDSGWAAPHYNLALLYKSQKREEALEHLTRAAELDASNPHLQMALGDEHFERQQWRQAIEAYRKAVSLRPDDDTLRMKLGHALYSGGLREEADREYKKAAELRQKNSIRR